MATLALCSAALGFAADASAQLLSRPGDAQAAKSTRVAANLVFCDGFDLILGCGAASALEAAPLVQLEQLSPLPVGNGGATPIEFRAGWPLIFRASIRAADMRGIGRIYGEQYTEPLLYQFAEFGQGAAIVFNDPDNFWSFTVPTPPNLPHDETVLEFYPDSGDVSRYTDDAMNSPLSHDPTRRFNLRPQFGGPLPQFDLDYRGLGTQQVPAQDGVQFGADDDFPGLVILSNVGVGIVMTDLANGWVPVMPRQARNLAGFMTSVGYELNDSQDQTSITAMMVVPRFLFSHLRLHDPCVGTVTLNEFGEPTSCAGAPVQRIDGGAVTPRTTLINDESIVELRAFVVAPVWNSTSNRLESLDTVVDMNGDGQLTATDAELMGHPVLSNEVVFTFRQIGSHLLFRLNRPYQPQHACAPIARPDDRAPAQAAGTDFEYDIDGNGQSAFDVVAVCPPGGSGITQPPR